MKQQSAYVLLQATMTDPDAFFKRYAIPAEVEVVRFGGQALLANFDRQVIEGAWPYNWTLMLKFPSLQAIHDWYQSPGYQAVLPNRWAATKGGNMVAIQGIPTPLMQWSVDRQTNAKADIRHPNTLDPNPEDRATIDVQWAKGVGEAVVEVRFPMVDAGEGQLCLEVNRPMSTAGEDARLGIAVRDESGVRFILGGATVHKGNEWTSACFNLPKKWPVTMRSAAIPVFNASRVNKVELRVTKLGSAPGHARWIVKRLKLTKALTN